MTIIGVYSQAPRAGKSTVAKIMASGYGATRIPFAGPLKEMIRAALLHAGLTDEQVIACESGDKDRTVVLSELTESTANSLAFHGISALDIGCQVRHQTLLAGIFLALLRTGCTYRKLLQVVGTEWGRLCVDESLWINLHRRNSMNCGLVVAEDVRFPNEMAYVDKLLVVSGRGSDGEHNNHISEGNDVTVDHYVIDNRGSAQDLRQQVASVMEKIGVE